MDSVTVARSKPMNVYVETLIRAPMDAVWAHTQRPELHERWDLRFTDIAPLPRATLAEPQRFLYTTRLGFGIAITGVGETVGQRDLPDGSRASALRFGSAHPLSLIREGSGYWKYVPTADGVRFFTSYDYETRFGRAGAAFDRFVFRPLIGWATAWSFDRLRLWLEQGIEPGQALWQAVIHGIARVGLAAVFLYQGVVPKLLGPDPQEVQMLGDVGVPAANIGQAAVALGIAEILLAVGLLALWHSRWLPAICAAFAIVSTAIVAVASPRYLGAAFNPVTLNLSVLCLASIDIVGLHGSPSAGRCRRMPGASVS
jgi:uncharacterized membrane protein YphA (DoxX/SURF4 family)